MLKSPDFCGVRVGGVFIVIYIIYKFFFIKIFIKICVFCHQIRFVVYRFLIAFGCVFFDMVKSKKWALLG